jgi:hypothetical protein
MFATGGVAPELAYVTAKFAALAPFARVADLLVDGVTSVLFIPDTLARPQVRRCFRRPRQFLIR